MSDQADPQGEQLINCPFCDEDPKQQGHFVVGKWILERPYGLVVQIGLTCMHALPDGRRDRWEPWTFFLVEELMSKTYPREGRTYYQEGTHDPRIPLTADDEEWARKLGEQIDGGEAPK
ncbi:hypothetical protein MYX64_06495 [Nitrospinae bacterium AH_259_B05_G02_I21]|nr:hypothetical protein [Nitrospinae bacterium AH_259_B05_G02_I21]